MPSAIGPRRSRSCCIRGFLLSRSNSRLSFPRKRESNLVEKGQVSDKKLDARLRGHDNKSVAFGVYVHWPFCAAKCPYCDFNSHVRSAIDESGWVDGILAELDWVALHQTERPVVETIFFGGGTPSLMEGRSVGRILSKIAALWPMGNDVEITLEANPASADAARFADYRAAGVNRVSLGVQALNDPDLK